MAGRIKKELEDLRIQMNEDNSIRNLIVDENNLFEWKLTICSADEPPNNLSYDIQIVFPTEYPWKPPLLKALPWRQWYPWMEKSGEIFLRMMLGRDWSPGTRITDLLNLLSDIFNKKTFKADIQDLRDEALVNDAIRNIIVDENKAECRFSIFPCDLPFNVASFTIMIEFSNDYPLNPPFITMLNKIYHPNIHSTGCICADCVGTGQTWIGYRLHRLMNPKEWKQRKERCNFGDGRWIIDTKLIDIIKLVVIIVNRPLQGEEHCCNLEIYNEFMNNHEMFNQKAMEHAIVHGNTR